MLYSDRSTLVMRKGEVVSVFSNRGEAAGFRLGTRAAVGWAVGEVLVEIFGCSVGMVDGGGGFNFVVDSGLPTVSTRGDVSYQLHTPSLTHPTTPSMSDPADTQVYYPASKLHGSGICGY